MTALCPECKDGEGEIIDRQKNYPHGFVRTYECSECNHE